MKLNKIVFVCLALLAVLSLESFSMESSSVHIVALEDGSFIGKTPFAHRVHIFAETRLEKDAELKEHGVLVSSVLVGKESALPSHTNITLVPKIVLFASYLQEKKSDDLVILNWSGSIGNPGLSEEILENLDDLNEHFECILSMEGTEFSKQVHDYIGAYDNFLKLLQNAPDNQLTTLLTYAKERLLEANAQTSVTQENKNSWLSQFSQKIKDFKKHAETKAWEVFNSMRTSILESLIQHENTLLVWALGNEGENCDDAPFWQELLSSEPILQHSLLVYGQGSFLNKEIHQDSNYTEKYAAHALGKPFQTYVWNERGYHQDKGTSFSAPLATIDAFNLAQKILHETGQTPLYSDVKVQLVKK